jgi:hypothetical protein
MQSELSETDYLVVGAGAAAMAFVRQGRRQRGPPQAPRARPAQAGVTMIPVEVTKTPWHYTTFWDWLDHWQTVILALVALLAEFIAVRVAEWRARKAVRVMLARSPPRRSPTKTQPLIL